MWDLKLILENISFWTTYTFFINLINEIDFVNPFTLGSFTFRSLLFEIMFPQNLAVVFSIKFIIVIMFLILVRGGTPRYRYDYLTKLGWLKVLGFVVTLFLSIIFFYFLF